MNDNNSNSGTIKETTITKEETIFWKIIKNKIIFKEILNRLSYDTKEEFANETCGLINFESMDWLINHRFRKKLKHKILNKHRLVCGDSFSVFEFFNNENEEFYEKLIGYFDIGACQELKFDLIHSSIRYSFPIFKYICSNKNGLFGSELIQQFFQDIQLQMGQNIFNSNTYFKCKMYALKNGILKLGQTTSIVWDEIITELGIHWNVKIQRIEAPSKYLNLIEYFKSKKIFVKYIGFLIDEMKIQPTKDQFKTISNTIFSICPIQSNLKIIDVIRLCNLIPKRLVKKQHDIKEQLNLLTFSDLELKKTISSVNQYTIDKNLSLLLQLFYSNRKLITYQDYPIYQYIFSSNPLFPSKSIKPIDFIGSEILSLQYGNFKLLKCWYQYCYDPFMKINKNQNGLIYNKPSFKNKLMDKLIHNGSNRDFLYNSIKPFSSLHEIITIQPLFKYNTCKVDQIEFIKLVCQEIKTNKQQFKLHPLIFFQLVIQYNNLELIQFTLDQLSLFTKSPLKIPLPPLDYHNTKIKENNQTLRTNSIDFKSYMDVYLNPIFNNQHIVDQNNQAFDLYNSIYIFKYIKSFDIFLFIFNKFGSLENLNIDWLKFNEMFKISGKQLVENDQLQILEKFNSISDLEYSFYKIAIHSQYNRNNHLIKQIEFDTINYNKEELSGKEYFKHVKFIINSLNDDDKEIHWSFEQLLLEYKRFNRIESMEFFVWLFRDHQEKIQSKSTLNFLKYLVYTYQGDSKSIYNELIITDIPNPQDKYFSSDNQYLQDVISNGDLTFFKMIIDHYYVEKYQDNLENTNLFTFINQFFKHNLNLKRVNDYKLTVDHLIFKNQ